MRKVIIIGSGPAGHTAAIYAGRATMAPLMFEGMMAGGVAAGGQLTTTTDIENFPGFPNGIGGWDLMDAMRQQSINCGAEVVTETVDSIDLSSQPYKVTVDGAVHETETIILATGATAQRLGLPGEEQFWNKGMSACAVCDGALPIFRDKPLVVIGGGDSACEEATFLTKFASKVYLLVRRDELRASKVMAQRAIDHDKIEILWNTEAEEALGDENLTHVRVKSNKTGEEQTLEASGLFYAIGHKPNTGFLNGQIELDESGYIVTQPGSTETNIPGVFACGDVQDRKWRQAITAAGSGCMAALSAEHYLSTK